MLEMSLLKNELKVNEHSYEDCFSKIISDHFKGIVYIL